MPNVVLHRVRGTPPLPPGRTRARYRFLDTIGADQCGLHKSSPVFIFFIMLCSRITLAEVTRPHGFGERKEQVMIQKSYTETKEGRK